MSDVTVVCCWNNEEKYASFVNTLKAQDCTFELIGIDNRGNKGFTSCAAAYNSVIGQVKTKYVMYSHQDILLNEPDTLAKFVSYLERTKRDDILGVAGAKFDVPGIFTEITDIDIKTGSLSWAGSEHLSADMEECNTVDECFFGGHTEHFRQYPFDGTICNGWHLYAVEACLRTQSNYVQGGGHIWVCDVPLIHNSVDGLDYSFYWQLFRLCRKYAQHFPRIRTTCSGASTDIIHSLNRLVRGTLQVFWNKVVQPNSGNFPPPVL